MTLARPPIALALLVLLSGLLSASSQPLTLALSNSTLPCPAWTGWEPHHIEDHMVYDLTYKRNCDNVTYVSYCLSTPVYVNFSHARFYEALNCSAKDFCQGWTRFYFEKSKNITERTPDNMTRTCVNSTFVSWCIRDHSNIDYKAGKRYSQLNCTEWAEACQYKLLSSLPKVEQQNGYCRACNQSTYRYACNYGGRTSIGRQQVQSVCGEWSDCGVLLGRNRRSPSNHSGDLPMQNPVGLDASSLLIALLLGVGLTVVLVVVFSAKKD